MRFIQEKKVNISLNETLNNNKTKNMQILMKLSTLLVKKLMSLWTVTLESLITN